MAASTSAQTTSSPLPTSTKEARTRTEMRSAEYEGEQSLDWRTQANRQNQNSLPEIFFSMTEEN
jgi:hypothetical protein